MNPLEPALAFAFDRLRCASVYGLAMKRRSKAGGVPTKGRRSKTPKPLRRNAQKTTPHLNAANNEKETEVGQLARELKEAMERQTATSDILHVISSSSGELEPVFDAILQNAARICQAQFGTLNLYDGTAYRTVALHNAPRHFARIRLGETFRPHSESGLARVARNKQIVQIDDIRTGQPYIEGDKTVVELADIAGARTLSIVPLLNKEKLVGTISIYRQEVRPFTDEQIELVKNFAAQAVIAIENARLLNELRQRTTDLTEALEQQTATSEVLQVISGSAGDVAPVFSTMLEKAVRICDATFGNIYRWDGEALHLLATHNTPPAFAEARSRFVLRPGASSLAGRMLASDAVVHIADVAATQAYEQRVPETVAAVELGGVRTILGVPMRNEDQLIGSFTLYRTEVRPFADKQIELVTNFAAQAVIAIENARLLNELRERTDDLSQRTTDLTEALEQQTATSEVLKVISSSPAELQAVFDAMLDKAVRICRADAASLFLYENGIVRRAARHSSVADAILPIAPSAKSGTMRSILTKQIIHIEDYLAEPAYIEGDEYVVAAAERLGLRASLHVPMLRELEVVGAFTIWRTKARAFTAKQIELVTNFAAQAVIAIENARLLNELRERTDQLQVQSKELADMNQQLEQRVADQVGEIERMGRLRRFLPPQVADLIVASGSEKQLESHRREITALFCDLRGFTGFTESADAEDVMALLRDYHTAIGEIIIKYNGTLERYAGDGVMVVFNDPVPVENPALQAVLMALELRDALGALTATWSRLGHEIGFGIGIAHGFATLGTIGFEGRFDYAAIGTVSNVASRLCDEAKPGQILISPRVLTKVEDTVKVEPVGEFELKGIRRPLAAFNVVGAVSAGVE
jgi:class 3 adenylate cyclase/DNA-binding FrmR family transcriptional regulator